MDLKLPIVYRGVNLSDSVYGPENRAIRGFDIQRVEYGEVAGEGYREKRAFDDGYDAGEVYLGFRNVQLAGVVYGESLTDLWDQMQRMRAAFTPTLAFADAPGDMGFVPLTYLQHTAVSADWDDGLMPLQMLLRPLAQPRFVVDADRLSGVLPNGYSMEWTCSLWARDPRIYVQTPQIKTMSGTSGSGTLLNRGDYPAPLSFVLYATGSAARVFDYTGAGSGFVVNIPASSNPRVIRVDSVNKVCTYEELSTETLRMDIIVFDQGLTWPRVSTVSPPGTYSWTCTGAGLAAGSQSIHHEAYA